VQWGSTLKTFTPWMVVAVGKYKPCDFVVNLHLAIMKVDFIYLQWWQNPIEACLDSIGCLSIVFATAGFCCWKLNFLAVASIDLGDITSLMIGLLLICLWERLMSSLSKLKQASSFSLIHVSGRFRDLSNSSNTSNPFTTLGGLLSLNLFF
jgi:hypothetical protein